MKTKQEKCRGFPQGVDCHKPAGTKWTPYWCDECDAKRRAHVTAQLDRIKSIIRNPGSATGDQ